jgi:hypothetical protein
MRTLLVALLVLLAGCAARSAPQEDVYGPWDDPTQSTTPTPSTSPSEAECAGLGHVRGGAAGVLTFDGPVSAIRVRLSGLPGAPAWAGLSAVRFGPAPALEAQPLLEFDAFRLGAAVFAFEEVPGEPFAVAPRPIDAPRTFTFAVAEGHRLVLTLHAVGDAAPWSLEGASATSCQTLGRGAVRLEAAPATFETDPQAAFALRGCLLRTGDAVTNDGERAALAGLRDGADAGGKEHRIGRHQAQHPVPYGFCHAWGGVAGALRASASFDGPADASVHVLWAYAAAPPMGL